LIANSFSNRGNKNGFVWEGRITNKMAGNYENKYDGKVYNSGFKENDGNLMLELIKTGDILISILVLIIILWEL
jgi:iron complex outermembrane receptor protein